MTWTRLDDVWSDRKDIRKLSLPARWYYLSLIQWCSRTQCYDGVVEMIDALRVSDIEDTKAALDEITFAGLVAQGEGFVTLARIGEHVPPPYMRDDERKARQTANKRRTRLHSRGDHTECTPDKCDRAVSEDPVSSSSPSSPVLSSPGVSSHIPGDSDDSTPEYGNWGLHDSDTSPYLN